MIHSNNIKHLRLKGSVGLVPHRRIPIDFCINEFGMFLVFEIRIIFIYLFNSPYFFDLYLKTIRIVEKFMFLSPFSINLFNSFSLLHIKFTIHIQYLLQNVVC